MMCRDRLPGKTYHFLHFGGLSVNDSYETIKVIGGYPV